MKLLFSTINDTKSPSVLISNIQQNPNTIQSSPPPKDTNVSIQPTSFFAPNTTSPFTTEIQYNMFGRIIPTATSGCKSCSSQK